jgi:Zn-dependent peptidase ImmA (M78 family)
MRGRISRDWEKGLVPRAERAAESLGGTDPAVALNLIAEHCKVRETIFRPLLIAGALALRDQGFALYVRSDKSKASERHEDFYSNGGRSLHPRLRFTIAHELVHTFLYDLHSSPPTPTLKAVSDDTFIKLEKACNRGANRLLLPESRMAPLMASDDFFVPEAFRDYARLRGVSLETLVIRCKSRLRSGTQHGGVAIVSAATGDVIVEIAAKDGLGEEYLSHLNEGEAVPPSIAEVLRKDGAGTLQEQCVSPKTGKVGQFATRWMVHSAQPLRWLVTSQLDLDSVVGRNG